MAPAPSRPLLQPNSPLFRVVSTLAVAVVYLCRRVGLPYWIHPVRRLRSIHRHWTEEMLRAYVASGATRLPHDQPCRASTPESYAPRVLAPEEHRLSEEDVRRFYEDGFLPPFRVCSQEEAVRLGQLLKDRRGQPSETYGFPCDRDRHLEVPEMLDLVSQPAIVDRLAQLLGPDLLLWRSQIFYKPPGNNPVGWHLSTTFMFEEFFSEPILEPPDLDDLFQLTVWMPADPATEESGCLRFLRGSLCEATRWMRLGGEVGFHDVTYGPDYEVDPERVVSVPVQPGEALIFAERTLHSSGPNRTDRDRMAFNFRVVPGDVEVYAHAGRYHTASQMGHVYDLEGWRGVLLRGRDRTGRARSVPVGELLPQGSAG